MVLAQLKTLSITDQLPAQGSTGNQPDTIYAKQLTQELLEIAVTDQNGKSLGISRNQKIFIRDDNWTMMTPKQYADSFGAGSRIIEFMKVSAFKTASITTGHQGNCESLLGLTDYCIVITDVVNIVPPNCKVYQQVKTFPFSALTSQVLERGTIPITLNIWQGFLVATPSIRHIFEDTVLKLERTITAESTIPLSYGIARNYTNLFTGELTFNGSVGGKARIKHQSEIVPSFLSNANINILHGSYSTTKLNVIHIECVAVENGQESEFDVWIYQKQ